MSIDVQAKQRLEDLEEMVQQRTHELRAANEKLLRENAKLERAEVALEQSEFSLRESQRVGRVGSYVLDIATGGWTSSIILDEILGIRQDYEKTVAGWNALVHPDDRENMMAYLAEVFAQKKRFERDYRIIRQNDGQGRWVLGLGELTLNDAGKPVRMIGVIQDITERKNYEQRIVAFSNLGERLSAVKKPKEAGKIIVSVADQLLGWDACSFALYSPDEDKLEHSIRYDTIDGQRAESKSTYDNSTPSPLARRVIAEGCQLILKENPNQMVEGSAPFGNVTRPSASILFVPVRDDSKVIGVLSIHSYTPNAYDQQSLATLQSLADHCGGALSRIQAEGARARLEDQFRQVQKMDAVGQLAGGVAHDFNNILAAVLMQLGLLQTEKSLTPHVKASLHELEEEVQRGARLMRQLLMFSRRQVMQMKLLNLNQVVVDMLNMLRRLLGGKRRGHFRRQQRPADGERGRRDDGAGGDESFGQCAGRDAEGRAADHCHSPGRDQPGFSQSESRSTARIIRLPLGDRYRLRHGYRHPATNLRTLFYNQGKRQRNRSGAGHGAWNCEAAPRLD
jgi:PAS domain S-box-containing protein